LEVNGALAAPLKTAEQRPAQLAVVETAPTVRRIGRADWQRYEGYLGQILEALGLEPDTPGTRETPQRLLRALYDSTAGYDGDVKLVTTFPAETRTTRADALGQIVEGPIAFHALCEHHALPFYGVAHVGYVAGEEIIGISKLTRLVRLYSKRFTVQERIGEQIADALMALIAPRGVAVHLEASHLCTRMRGVEEHSATVTTFWRGAFADPALRQEFLTEVHGRKAVV
jgi:GTP cyclohydrolase I